MVERSRFESRKSRKSRGATPNGWTHLFPTIADFFLDRDDCLKSSQFPEDIPIIDPVCPKITGEGSFLLHARLFLKHYVRLGPRLIQLHSSHRPRPAKHGLALSAPGASSEVNGCNAINVNLGHILSAPVSRISPQPVGRHGYALPVEAPLAFHAQLASRNLKAKPLREFLHRRGLFLPSQGLLQSRRRLAK